MIAVFSAKTYCLYGCETWRMSFSDKHKLEVAWNSCFRKFFNACWHHMSTKTVPTVYQQCTKNSQQTVKTAQMTIGVPIVTGLPRLYQQCNNSLPIVNKNLAIANRSCVSCAHNTSRAFIGLNITLWVTLKSRLRVTQDHWKRNTG